MTSRQSIPDELASMLNRLADTIVSSLGFDVVVISLVRPDGMLEVASAAGHESVRSGLLGTVATAEAWDESLSGADPQARLRFLRFGRADSRALTSRPAEAMGTAHEIGPRSPRDALLLPLTSSDGSRLGILAAVTGGDDEPPATIRNALHACAVPAALAIEHATQRSRAEASERALLHQAMSDPLTGVGTRTLLLERLRHATTARPESRAAMALVFIDLDHFKVINDHHTHAVGDRVLRTVAQRIETAVRAHDTVARWGGDEFLVLLHPLADEHSALGAVKRVLATIAEPIVEGGLTLTVTASIGVTFWTSAQPVDVEEMVRRADAAMYEAKDNGGDCFSLFEALDAQSSRHLHLDDLLSRAVVEDRVVVHYQPIVRVADHGVVGVEALLRLRDDDGALVYPDELLRHGAPPGDVARELMLRACTDVACWVGQGHDLWLALNVAAPQVADVDGFVDDVSKALASPGLAPERLTLELTEHTLLNTSARTLAGIEDLVARGLKFSIDDFGTGFGSMTYLRVMPVHELKIDRSFITEAPERYAATAIIRSIASLADDLGIRCVAEGVENPAQHELVRAAGVQLAQGLYYSAALDADALEALLEQARRTPSS